MIGPDFILERLSRLHPKIIDLDLSRIERLLAQLGNPHHRLPPVIHVAGTNGKGSTIAYLRAINEAAGKKVHVYTSPHLVRFRERIRLAGELIDDAELQALLEECEKANGDAPITLFEITSAAAFLAFSRHPADLLLLETGLGGRLDATNVIQRPLASIITPISMDHQQYLGNNLRAIAREKAGIIKENCPVVIGKQVPEVLNVLTSRAMEQKAPMHRFGEEFKLEPNINGFYISDHFGHASFPFPNLPGNHQIENAATAIATMRYLEKLAPRYLTQGIQQAAWPARLHKLNKGPLVDRLLPQSELWLDGGHNEAAGEILAQYFSSLPQKEWHVIFAMLTTKDPGAFLQHLKGKIASLHCLTIPGEHQSFIGSDLAKIAQGLNIEASADDKPLDALNAIQAKARGPQRILICGSLYLAGSILADHE